MKLHNAIKLARKHGEVNITDNDFGGKTLTCEMANGRKVTLEAGSYGVQMVTTHYPDGVIRPARCLYLALCRAKYRKIILSHNGCEVIIHEAYKGQAVKQVFNVLIDDRRVTSDRADFVSMILGAIETQCPVALMDWVEEYHTFKGSTLVMV